MRTTFLKNKSKIIVGCLQVKTVRFSSASCAVLLFLNSAQAGQTLNPRFPKKRHGYM